MHTGITPHGSELKPLLIGNQLKDSAMKRARSLKSIMLDSMEVSDLMMLSSGAFSPLNGFMNHADYVSVVSDMRLENGVLWPIPITLAVSKKEASSIKPNDEITLKDKDENLLAILSVEVVFKPDIKKEARFVFKTLDPAHPGVARALSQKPYRLGGKIQVLNEGNWRTRFPEYATPMETRQIFQEKGWERITAFQTRNPMHRSHEYLTKLALEVTDGLLIHPVVGKLKSGDIPAAVRMACYRTLVEKYYPKDRVILKVYPMEMRYAGPREAILHAIIRQNFGCSHIIIGRDHAGVGNYYGSFDAQEIFDQLAPDDLLIKPMKFEHAFWCRSCDGMASIKTCPHPDSDHLTISGTKLREMFANNVIPPKEVVRPEVSEILVQYYRDLSGK